MRKLGVFLISHFIVIAWVLAGVAISISAQAGDLRINVDEVKVYAQPDPGSDVVTTLFKGDLVKVSNKPMPGYQKVRVQTSGGAVIGYIKNSDLSLPKTLKPGAKKHQQVVAHQNRSVVQGGPRGISRKWAVSLYGGANYQTQGERTITTDSGSIYNISSLGGLSTQFGLALQFPLAARFAGKAFFESKSISVTGSAGYQSSSSVASVPSDIYLKEQFFTFGGGAQYYFNPYFWAGAGLQVDKISTGTIKAGGNSEVTLSSSDLVMFFAAYVSTGYEFGITKNIFLTPNLKLISLFSKPLIFEVDGVLSISYAF